jgi:hypothetical protein
MTRLWGLFTVIVLLGGGPAWGQVPTDAPADTTQPWYDTAWTPILTKDGVRVAYIFYSEADNVNDGVVLRLRNENDYSVRYTFTVIFRGPGAEATARAEGTLEAGQMKTGEEDGLFWIPFREGGHSIGELGLRGFRIQRLDDRRPPRAGG